MKLLSLKNKYCSSVKPPLRQVILRPVVEYDCVQRKGVCEKFGTEGAVIVRRVLSGNTVRTLSDTECPQMCNRLNFSCFLEVCGLPEIHCN